MHIHGIKLAEGARVKNLTVDSGPVFPDLPNTGELFYRTDTNKLFVHDGTNWTSVAQPLDNIVETVNNRSGNVTIQNTDVTTALGFTPAPINSPTFTGTVGGITKAMVGLGNADNTSDENKPLSLAARVALGGKATLSGSSSQDFATKTLTAAGNVIANGFNTLSIAGGDSGVSPSVIARGNDAHVGMYFGTKGQGEYNFCDGNSLTQFCVGVMPNAVSYIRIVGGADGGNPTVSTFGTPTNIGIDFTAKGAGEFIYRSNGGIQFAISSLASPVNFPKTIASVTGNGVTFAAEGQDTTVNVHLRSKGTGTVALQGGGRNVLVAQTVDNSVNFVSVFNSVTGAGPSVRAEGTDTNINLTLQPKGTGFVNIPAAIKATSITLDQGAPAIHFFENDQTGAIGVWRQVADSGALRWDLNTSTARGFATYTTPITIAASGEVQMQNAAFSSSVSMQAIFEKSNIVASAPAATQNIDIASGAVWYFTAAQTANTTLNIRSSSTASLSSVLAVGQSATIAVLLTQGTTAFYPTAYQIDGVAVTPRWNGTAPTSGNASSIDSYTLTIIKTAATPTYTVLASRTKYA